jgi:hypothetical protein
MGASSDESVGEPDTSDSAGVGSGSNMFNTGAEGRRGSQLDVAPRTRYSSFAVPRKIHLVFLKVSLI